MTKLSEAMPVYESESINPYESIPVRDADSDPHARQVFVVDPIAVGPYGGVPIRLVSDPLALPVRGLFDVIPEGFAYLVDEANAFVKDDSDSFVIVEV